jgi:hypothetical protein
VNQYPDPLQPYRAALTVPLVAVGALSLFWVLGGPQLGGGFEQTAYWLSALAVFVVALWCGMTASMITLEVRAAKPAPPTAVRSLSSR